jgi:hypothetical protein
MVQKKALSENQKKAKADRAFRRRQEEKKANGSAVDMKTGDRYEISILPRTTAPVNAKVPMVTENMKILRAPDAGKVYEKQIEKRARYAAMKTHKEIAAHVIAAGGSPRQAAEKIGITRRQVRSYMEDADFRDRIKELQETLGSRLLGRVMKELGRRTTPKVIKKMELLDLLRVGDRVGLGRGNANTIINDNREVHNYEATFNQLFHQDAQQLPDATEEGADFPEFEPTSVALSGGDSQVDG